MGVELFFGLSLDESFLEKLKKVNPSLYSLLIPEYLQKITLDNQEFLGKNLGKMVDMDSLLLAKNHIISILNKLVPEYTYIEDSLVLFPLLSNE